MGQLTAVDPQNSCRFYRVNLFTNAISRFTTISMLLCASYAAKTKIYVYA